jgi:glycosyltransferase involved in cell wall biosynthesis
VLSFLVPLYNAADVVSEAIESALAQRLDVSFDVVVVDDASSDGSAAVVERLRGPGSPVQLIRHEENRGGGAARNTAARASEADLLYVLDADNVLLPDTVQSQLDCLRSSGAPAVSVATQRFFDGGSGQWRQSWDMPRDHRGMSTLMHALTRIEVPGAHGNYLFSRALFDRVGGYAEDLGAMDTWTFGLAHLAHGLEIAIAPETAYMHRIDRPHHQSYWTRQQTTGTNDLNALIGLGRVLDLLPGHVARKVSVLASGDRVFEVIQAGLFAPEIALDGFRAELAERRERWQAASAPSGLRSRVAGLLRR